MGRDLVDSRRVYDEPVWSVAYQIKRITGHEGKRRRVGRAQNRHVVRSNHSDPIHLIMRHAFERGELDCIVLPDILEGAKEGIAVSCNAAITQLARQWRAGDMAQAKAQGP